MRNNLPRLFRNGGYWHCVSGLARWIGTGSTPYAAYLAWRWDRWGIPPGEE